jgi:DNA-binding IclR family transcriptional regulator
VLDGWDALFVERLSRRGSAVNRAQIAGRMPVHVSSAGIALMAGQPPEIQAEYLQQFHDPAGRLAPEELRALLKESAGNGFAQLAGVVDPDTWGIAVPVRDPRSRTVAALGVVVPLLDVRLQALVPALQTAARGIGRQLNTGREPNAGTGGTSFRSSESV